MVVWADLMTEDKRNVLSLRLDLIVAVVYGESGGLVVYLTTGASFSIAPEFGPSLTAMWRDRRPVGYDGDVFPV